MISRKKIQSANITVKCCKLSRFSHVCHHEMLLKITITLQGTVDWMVVIIEEDLVNHGRASSRNRQASRCRHCCASRMTQVTGQSLQWMHLSEYSSDVWASRVLVSLSISEEAMLLFTHLSLKNYIKEIVALVLVIKTKRSWPSSAVKHHILTV